MTCRTTQQPWLPYMTDNTSAGCPNPDGHACSRHSARTTFRTTARLFRLCMPCTGGADYPSPGGLGFHRRIQRTKLNTSLTCADPEGSKYIFAEGLVKPLPWLAT